MKMSFWEINQNFAPVSPSGFFLFFVSAYLCFPLLPMLYILNHRTAFADSIVRPLVISIGFSSAF